MSLDLDRLWFFSSSKRAALTEDAAPSAPSQYDPKPRPSDSTLGADIRTHIPDKWSLTIDEVDQNSNATNTKSVSYIPQYHNEDFACLFKIQYARFLRIARGATAARSMTLYHDGEVAAQWTYNDLITMRRKLGEPISSETTRGVGRRVRLVRDERTVYVLYELQ
jgi:hypothetical protein